MFQTNALSLVKQLAIEIHFQNWQSTDGGLLYKPWKLLSHLEELGFRSWSVSHNYANVNYTGRHPDLTGVFCCSNVHFINVDFIGRWKG